MDDLTDRDGTPWYHRNYVEVKGEYGNSILVTTLVAYEKTSVSLFRIRSPILVTYSSLFNSTECTMEIVILLRT